jgi:peptidoglycan/LPS O-acetylase OafA/YrhL
MKTGCMDTAAGRDHDHYITLDGLRGLAALAVFLFHLTYYWPSGIIFPQANIAVDFFFLLSGFVIAKSYDAKLRGTMRFKQFVRLRLIRLYPLIFLGIMIGTTDNLMKLHSSAHESLTGVLLDTAAGLIILPDLIPSALQLYPLNPPMWSLFYELLANFAYAAVAKILRLWLIGTIIFAAAAAFAYIAYTTGDTSRGSYPTEYPSGLSRVFFSFFMGLLLYRLQEGGFFRWLPRIPGLWLFLVLGVALFPGTYHGGWLYDLACIFLLFPLIVLLGARDRLPRPAVPVAAWLGRISYPLYALHYPLIIRNSYQLTHGRQGLALAGAGVFATLLMLLLAWLAAAFYDEPVRRFLTRAFRLGSASSPARAADRASQPAAPRSAPDVAPPIAPAA